LTRSGNASGLSIFVDGDDDWNFGGVCVVDGFERLRHYNTIIGCDHQHDYVGGFGAAGAHARECFVTGRVEEYDLAPVGGRSGVQDANFVCADVLG